MITDHKLLVAIFKKDIQTLSPILQRILYKLFIADWLSRHNCETNRDEEKSGMCININAKEACN